MKILPRVLFASLLGVVTSFAGGFGGPPPFQNGSPLQSGIDGTYQASMSTTNFSGIIRFAYSNQTQTASPAQNSWIAMQNGTVYRGTTQTTMNKGSITGILDSDDLVIPTSDDGSIDLPVVFVIRGSRASGKFVADLDLDNSYGQFTGSGTLQGSSAEEIQIVGIAEVAAVDNFNLNDTNQVPPGGIIVTTGNITLNEGSLPFVKFNVRGVRSSTTASGSSVSTNSQ